MAYNSEHGITPQSVKSHIKDIVDSVYEKDHVTISIGKGKDGREKVEVGANLAAVIKDLEREMREAATNLEFERAARLRDEIKRLREVELDVLDGEIG
jgi:excinuclease ABC subunit B